MDEKMQVNRGKSIKKIMVSGVIIVILIAIMIIFLSAKPSDKVFYLTTNGSEEFSCDGVDDQIEINRALAYVAENPQYKAVHLEGNTTYIISDSILIGDNTVLEGDSTTVIKLEDKANWPADKPIITQMNSSGNHDITIRGFEIDGNHNGNAEKKRGAGYYNLIHLLNCENIKVYNLYMHDSHGDGLKVTRCSNVQFYNNTVYKLGHDALYVIYSSDVEAWDNRITCRTNSCLRIYNSNKIKFYNNVINSEGEGGAGIQVQKDGSSFVMDDIEIFNNLLYETNAAGIWITGYGSKYSKDTAKDIYIHNNKFYKTGTNKGSDWAGGVVINGFQNTLIENNLFDGCYGAAIAHKRVNSFSAPESGYTTIVKNNIIINTQPSREAGKGYAIFNKLNNTHSFVLENNCLSNNIGGNYLYANSTSDINVNKGYVEQVNENESMRKDFPWSEALSAGTK